MKAALLTSILALAFGIPAAILRGVVISILWTWFIVPLNYSIPYLPVAHAIGFSMTVYLIIGYFDPSEHSDERLANSIILSYVMPIIALIAGAIVRHWM